MSTNPGDGKQNENVTGASVEEPIIQEVFEEEPDDYNYVPQIQEVDEEELRNLSAIRKETKVDTRVYKVCAGFLVAALIGGAIGMFAASRSAAQADVERKSSMASTIRTTIESRLEQFEKFAKEFEQASGSYDPDTFDAKVGSYSKYGFMLDMSSDVTSESVLLAGDTRANPLSGLRKYSADTMLLTQLLSSHINETHADSEAIIDILDKREMVDGDDSRVQYAMQIIPDGVYYLLTTAPRSMYANGAVSVYTYLDVIDDDEELSKKYSKLKEEKQWGQFQKERRDYVPANPKEQIVGENGDPLDIPNRLLYKVMDRRGNETLLFADEVVLVDRTLLFGKSMDALERYEQRTAQIKKLIAQARSDSSSIVSDLSVFMTEQAKADYAKNKAGGDKGKADSKTDADKEVAAK